MELIKTVLFYMYLIIAAEYAVDTILQAIFMEWSKKNIVKNLVTILLFVILKVVLWPVAGMFGIAFFELPNNVYSYKKAKQKNSAHKQVKIDAADPELQMYSFDETTTEVSD